jgi:chemotaxis protein methyltransferase CheR
VTDARSNATAEFPLDELNSLVDWISSQTGLSFRNQRENAAKTIARYILKSGDDSPAACRQRLKIERKAFDELVGELTIGETYFFRDERQFDLIAGEFLNTVRDIRPVDHRFRFWSAGCSSGEEVWSLAALLKLALLDQRSDVLGTDISQSSLARARAGEYGAWSLRGASGDRMRRWGKQIDRRFIVSDSLRSMVSFEYLNLAADQYPSFTSKTNGLDLILCRNVMIYFDRETVRSVSERLFRCLAPGGWLIMGASDPPLADYAPFKVLMRDCGQVYVRPEQVESTGADDSRTESSRLPVASSRATRPAGAQSMRFQRTSVDRPDRQRQNLANEIPQQVRQARVGRDGECTAPLETVQRALAKGEYERVLALTSEQVNDATCCILRVRALASLDTAKAEAFCRQALSQHRVSKELHYLQAILLTELARYGDAMASARSAVYLDQNLIVGHLALGCALERLGQTAAACRSFRNAQRLSEAWPIDQPVPFADGESAERLAESASQHLAILSGDA